MSLVRDWGGDRQQESYCKSGKTNEKMLDKEEQERQRPEELHMTKGQLEATCWESPDQAGHRSFELSLDTGAQVQGNFVEQETEMGLDVMLAEEGEGAAHHQKQQHQCSGLETSTPSGQPLEEGEEYCQFSLLFAPPEDHDWVSVPEPYVPKFPTEEEIRERKERRKEQLKQAMEPITRPVSEPARGRNYSMGQPGTAVTRDARLPDRPALFNYWTLSDKSESMWQPKSNVYPTLACLEWCNCTPSTMLQVYTLELIVADSFNSCKLNISGFISIRDFKDGKRNYIFNREMTDPLTTVSHEGVLLLPTLSPRRAIDPTILLEFDLKMKRTGDGIDGYQQLIQGLSEHPTGGRYWSRVNELSIRSADTHSIPMMRVRLAMIRDGVEATIELRPLTLPSQGINLRCVARTGRICDDIVLLDGRYGGGDPPLQFVVAAEQGGNMEIHLEGVSGGAAKRWSIGFVPKFHAVFSEAVDLEFAQVSLSVAWSHTSIHRTYGPPDL